MGVILIKANNLGLIEGYVVNNGGDVVAHRQFPIDAYLLKLMTIWEHLGIESIDDKLRKTRLR